MSAKPFHSSSFPDIISDPADARLANDVGIAGRAASGFHAQEDTHHPFIVNLREQISQRAYELAEQRGFAPGNELEDWLRAEQEVLAAPID